MAFVPTAGFAAAVQIGAHFLNSAFVETDININLHEAPCFQLWGVPHSPGLYRGTFRVSGIWDNDLNPFASGIDVGSRQAAIISVNDDVSAHFAAVICAEWTPSSDADGTSNYVGLFVIDGEFEDFSGDDAISDSVNFDLGTFN